MTTYIEVNTAIQITEGDINNTWYYGSLDTNVFTNTTTITNFTNNGIILGGGGSSNGNNGKNGFYNISSITNLVNNGAFLGGGGGGGGGPYGGSGGAGGGGGGGEYPGHPGGSGGSLINPDTNGYGGSGRGGGGGGGPFGYGGKCQLINSYGGSGYNNISTGSGADTYVDNTAGGGGGYGGNAGFSGGGGGGGGGLGAGGGNGGYSINNSGTITTLINAQGCSSTNTTYYYGPLFYNGNVPDNYEIVINNPSQYGQIWFPSTGVVNLSSFNVSSGSTLTIGVYSSVLANANVVGSLIGAFENKYSWELVQNGIYYDLLVTKFTYPCFKEGTKILTNTGYVSIENLRKGHLIKTSLSGYKAIDMIGKSEINHHASKSRIPDQLYKCSQDKYPEVFEDLILTGCHSILVNDIASPEQREKIIKIIKRVCVTDKKYRLPACVDERASIYESTGIFTIYHLALENSDYHTNYGIWANGLLVESCSKRYLKEHSNMTLIE